MSDFFYPANATSASMLASSGQVDLYPLIPVDARRKIAGWNLVYSGQYFRAFRKIRGWVFRVLLDREIDLESAEKKIQAKEQEIQKA